MSEDAKPVTIEISEPAVASSKPQITIDEAKESGLSAAEVADAKRFGMVSDSTDEEKPESKATPTTEGENTQTPATEQRKPENTDIRELVDQELDPEKEADAVKDFKPNEKALYWKFKKEKRQRQRLEEENKSLREKQANSQKTDAVVEELRRKIAALEAGKKVEGGEDVEAEDDEDLDRPLTKRELMELARKQNEENQRIRDEQQQKITATRQKLEKFEEVARERYEDFDRVMELSAELVKQGDTLLPAGHPLRKKAELAVKRLKFALENPDQFSDEYGVADIAYELGELHPRFKSSNAPDPAAPNGKQEPGLSPEQMERLKKNASRPPVSASVTGGAGRRVVSEDDITPAMAENLTQKQWEKLSDKTKARLLGAPE
jgi:hypothetical protein